MKYAAIILIALVVIVVGPLLTIWSLNTLFPALAIEYGIDTYIAALLLTALIAPKK